MTKYRFPILQKIAFLKKNIGKLVVYTKKYAVYQKNNIKI